MYCVRTITMAERENMSHRFNVYVTIDYGFFVYDHFVGIITFAQLCSGREEYVESAR